MGTFRRVDKSVGLRQDLLAVEVVVDPDPLAEARLGLAQHVRSHGGSILGPSKSGVAGGRMARTSCMLCGFGCAAALCQNDQRMVCAAWIDEG